VAEAALESRHDLGLAAPLTAMMNGKPNLAL
jgi:hypothetical protein